MGMSHEGIVKNMFEADLDGGKKGAIHDMFLPITELLKEDRATQKG